MVEDMADSISGQAVVDAGLDDWRQLAQGLHARFATGNFATGLQLVNRVAEAAEAANHHPDVDLRYGFVAISLLSHDVGAITQRDLDLAEEISAIADSLGVSATPDRVQQFEVALDTSDYTRVKPFWIALLGYAPLDRSDDEIRDPDGRLLNLWFQESDEHEVPHQRFHFDVWVPHDQAESRIAAALAAGGTMVNDEEAPSFWVLADSDGNRACVCTWQDRGA